MRARTALTAARVAVVAAGSASPSFAGEPSVTVTYTFTYT